jgi:tRNA(fMet)-specific endonuclease VapC
MLDADVIIAAEKRTFDLHAWFKAHSDDEFEIAAITVAELWHGLERASGMHKTQREIYLRSTLGGLPIIPYTQTTALEHARIWAELESTGRTIGDYDLIVAASALERGSSVATFNQRHFTRVRGLQVIQPR